VLALDIRLLVLSMAFSVSAITSSTVVVLLQLLRPIAMLRVQEPQVKIAEGETD
jgi:hypothetical protein